ncbi:MAG: GHKL domain-containing protein [Anaerovoracaceae bacterium]
MDFALFFWLSSQYFSVRWRRWHLAQYSIIVLFASLIFFVNQLHLPKINTLAAFVCALAINFILFSGSNVARFLCAVAEVLIIVICEFIPISIYSLIYGNGIAIIANETIRNAGFNLISTFIFGIIIIIIRFFISTKKANNNKNITITENIYIMVVPFVSMFIIYYILDVFGNASIVDEINAWQVILIFLGILLMNIVVITSDNNVRKRYQLQNELESLNQKEELNQVIIKQQDQFISDMQGIAHDYTKQMEGLKLLLCEHEICDPTKLEFQRYANEMQNVIQENCRFAFIPTPALRSIFSQTQLRCNSANIRFDVEIQYADFSFLAFPDVYSIFENMLDNAVAACADIQSSEVSKIIILEIIRKKDLIGIKIKNSKSNKIIIKNDTILTTKQESDNHGLGIRNMQKAVKAYEGFATITYTDEFFTVYITLPVPSN